MSNKINITIVHPIDPLGSKIGGIETTILTFIKYAPKNFDIELVGITENKKKRPLGRWIELSLHGRNIRYFPILHVVEANKRTLVPLALRFALSLFLHSFDLTGRVLEFHRIEPVLRFFRKPNRKLLFIHENVSNLNNPNHESRWRTLVWFYFRLEKMVMRLMDKVFVVSSSGVSFYKHLYPRMAFKFQFLPGCVDKEVFHPYSEEGKEEEKRHFLLEHGFKKGIAKIILFVGRLELTKDPILLVDTYAYVHSRTGPTRLLIIGTGSLEAKIKSYVKNLGLQKYVLFLHNLSQSRIAEILNISDVLLLTSVFEGMPLAVLEALACGVPVVSNDAGDVRLVIEDGMSGRIIKEREATKIGDAVLDILKNRKRSVIEDCTRAVEPYVAQKVLQNVYLLHHHLVM